jgi:FlaA1/EpsC-like NDP-sugar epimerase
MVSKVIYLFLPFLLAVGLLRKFREYQWGRCKSKSSLNGKVLIVTGANSGIGKETVRELARRKARVIMACRDLESAKNAIEDIRRDVSSGELVSVFQLVVYSRLCPVYCVTRLGTLLSLFFVVFH